MPTWTQAEIDAIKAKILGAKSVSYAGGNSSRSVTNYDLEALLKQLLQMEADNAAAASAGGDRSTYAVFSRD